MPIKAFAVLTGRTEAWLEANKEEIIESFAAYFVEGPDRRDDAVEWIKDAIENVEEEQGRD